MESWKEARVEAMKQQTIKVEIEMWEIKRSTACKIVVRHFETDATARYIGGAYDSWACKDNESL